MKNILSEGQAAIERVARERMVIVFDFDGTLAPLVPDPDEARMGDSTRTLLRLVALLHPCAVISGRARADVTRRLEGVPLVAIVGNHGAEAGRGPVDGTVRARVAGWAESARSRLRGVPGVEIEDKGLSLAVHYRRAADPEAAERAVAKATRALKGARVFRGHAVVNVVPPSLHDKGAALARVLSRVGRSTAMYVGDDTTDEDAFRSASVEVSVRVGHSTGSAAAYFVPSQPDVDDLLRCLVRCRRRLDGLTERLDALERLFR
jgi:trehalose 6-phosphate phosphatase